MNFINLTGTQNSPKTNLDDFKPLLSKLGLYPSRHTSGKNHSNFFHHSSCIAEGYNRTEKLGIYVMGYGLLKDLGLPILFDTIYEINELGKKSKNKKGKIRYILGAVSGIFKGYLVNDDYSLTPIENQEGLSNFDNLSQLYAQTAISIEKSKGNPNTSLFQFQSNRELEKLTSGIPIKIDGIVNTSIKIEKTKDPKTTILDNIQSLSTKLDKSDKDGIKIIVRSLEGRLKSTIKKQLKEEGLNTDNEIYNEVMLEMIKDFIEKNY